MTTQDPSRRRTRRANGLATRQRVLEVATQMFADGGYEATSLRQISAAASIDLATLKYHFGDKPSLFSAVYQDGHEAFLRHLEPILIAMGTLETPEQTRALIERLASTTCAFIDTHPAFVRMVLYRIMEDSADIAGMEDELQVLAVTMLEQALDGLIGRGLIRPVDVRAFIVTLVASIPMWFVTGQVKPTWIAAPQPTGSPEGRARAEAFITDLMTRMLLP